MIGRFSHLLKNWMIYNILKKMTTKIFNKDFPMTFVEVCVRNVDEYKDRSGIVLYSVDCTPE